MMGDMLVTVEVTEGNMLVQLTPLERALIKREARLVALCLNGDEALVPDEIMECARDCYCLMQEAYPDRHEGGA